MKNEDDEPSFIQHGRGELDEYTEVIAEYEKFKVLNSAKRLEVMVAVNFLENVVLQRNLPQPMTIEDQGTAELAEEVGEVGIGWLPGRDLADAWAQEGFYL
eukprot:COSAG02_NODE_1221_length_13805_cov_24.976653_6_plen_101_part_00